MSNYVYYMNVHKSICNSVPFCFSLHINGKKYCAPPESNEVPGTMEKGRHSTQQTWNWHSRREEPIRAQEIPHPMRP